MEEVKQDLNSLKEDPRDTDLHYCHFFYNVINKLVDLENDKTIGLLKRYFQLVQPKRCFGTEVRDTGFEDVDVRPLMESLFFKVIQIYRSGLVTSSAVDFHFRNLFKENRNLLHKVLKKRVLRICSIGGRLPSDLVALVTVLHSIAKDIGQELDIRVTVIETDNTWKITCFTVLSCMEAFREDIWKIQFVSSSLPEFDEPIVKKIVSEADIVTMVKFHSEFKDVPIDISGVMQKINNMIRPGSILFFLDFSKDSVIEFCGYASGMLPNAELLYEELCDLHALDPDAVEKNFHLYLRKIMKPYYSKYLNVFVRIWLKKVPTVLPAAWENCTFNPSTFRHPTYKLDTSEDVYKGRRWISTEECEETLDSFVEKERKTCPGLTEKDLLLRFESRFRKKEKYNPKQNFLTGQTFEKWEKKFKEEASQSGKLSWRAAENFVLLHKEERNILLVQLLKNIKTLESIQKELVRDLSVFREDYDGICEKQWKKYLTEKRNFSAFKLKIYSLALNMQNKRLEKVYK